MITLTNCVVKTPGGRQVVFTTRDGTNDAGIAISLNALGDVQADEYRMTGRTLSGWAIDVGAHIGAFSVSLALDQPHMSILAVEAVPENVIMLEKNVRDNGVSDRVTVVPKFAASPGTQKATCHYGYRHEPSADDNYVSAHRFVGETWGASGEEGDPEFTPEIEAVSLDDLLERYGIEDVSLLKIDCEGCEWNFLDTPSVSRVETIVGEYHGRSKGAAHPVKRLRELLPTHDVVAWSDDPVNGLFEATRR